MRHLSIVQKVQQMISQGSTVLPPDASSVAKDYAELCKRANRRLSDCANFLHRGMMSEALRIAEMEPPLLDMCGALDFIGVEKWRSLCEQQKWTLPESIDSKAIQALNEAYNSAQSVEPLLKAYRRSVRLRDTKACIRALRRLVEVDKTKPHWAEDIKGFEQKRLAEIRDEFEVAKRSESIEQLAALLAEINGTWNVPRDKTLQGAIKACVNALYGRQAMAKAGKILEEVAAAYSAFDYERLTSAINSYLALMAEGYLKPDSKMQTQFEEAREWHQQETRRREEERLWSETVDGLRDAVEKEDAGRMSEHLNQLARSDRPIPDRLEERARSLLEAHRVSVERRRKRWITLSFIALLLLAAGIIHVIGHFQHQKTKAHLLAALELAYKGKNLDACCRLLDQVGQAHPKVAHAREFEGWPQKINNLDTMLREKSAIFETTISKLEAARDAGFNIEEESMESMFELARENVTTGESTGRLAVLLKEWNSHKQTLKAEEVRSISANIDELGKELDALARAKQMDDDSAIEQLRALEERIKPVELAAKSSSEENKARVATLSQSIGNRIREHESRKRQLAAIRGAKSLSDYLSALQVFAAAFSNELISVMVQPVLAMQRDYLDLIEPPSFCRDTNVFWHNIVAQDGALDERVLEEWPGIKEILLNIENDDRMTALWQFKLDGLDTFAEGKPEPEGDSGRERQGMVYQPEAQDLQPAFRQLTFQLGRVTYARVMAHCEFMKSLVSTARFATPGNAADELLERMQALHQAEDISPLLKLRIMSMLAKFVAKLSDESEAQIWNAFIGELDSIDPTIHWLCIKHRDVVIANEKAAEILDRHFGSERISAKIQFIRQARKTALSRRIQWVGYAELSQQPQLVLKTAQRLGEIWVVRSAPDEGPSIRIASEFDGEKEKRYISYIPGEPVFSPADGKTTRQHLEQLQKTYGPLSTRTMPWPVCWPKNLR